MDNKSILQNISDAINNIDWSLNSKSNKSSKTKKQFALELCIHIFNKYYNGDYYQLKQVSTEEIREIITTNSYSTEIKNTLILNNILETNNKFFYKEGNKNSFSIGYRINPKIIDGDFVLVNPILGNLGNKNLGYPKKSSPKNNILGNLGKGINQDKIGICDKVNNKLKLLNNTIGISYTTPKIFSYIGKGLERLKIDDNVYNWIDNFELKREDIKVDDEIKEDWIKIIEEDKDEYYWRLNAQDFADKNNISIIKYKKNCYYDTVESFLERKTKELRIIFRKNIFDIENDIFRVDRNETNRRLDYNLTNMKSNMLEFLRLDGEELIELDISNAQFSILSFLSEDLDEDFVELSRSGKLYEFISNKCNITKEEAKEKMFRVAFDKVKSSQDDIRNLFPKTMFFIDEYKKKYSYKAFSNLCQNTESIIMIDGLLNRLIDLGYDVFTIHDAIRVKKSQVDLVRDEINKYFNEIDFKCNLRVKDKQQIYKHIVTNFKGPEMEFDIYTSEIYDFKLQLIKLRNESILSEWNLVDNLKSIPEIKVKYLYNNYLKNHKVSENNKEEC